VQDELIVQFVAIGLLGSFAQWLAWRIKVPSILFLLLIGIVIGPGLGLLKPDQLFGDALSTVISLAVSVILFEGSLTLHFSEINGLEKIVRRVVTSGILLTWLLITMATYFFMDFPWPLSFLFGAIVVVTGPTVIIPLLRTVNPNTKIANILKWEGILIDPIGALLAVVVFELIVSSNELTGDLQAIIPSFIRTISLGVSIGFLTGHLLGYALKKHWIPDFLHNYVTLSLVFAVFAGTDLIESEAGLLSVTVMGLTLANLKGLDMEHILNFKESLSILLISGLFILLAARLIGYPIYRKTFENHFGNMGNRFNLARTFFIKLDSPARHRGSSDLGLVCFQARTIGFCAS
jgi:NhaP-type Na+/H+ or K+/H+ antiporter